MKTYDDDRYYWSFEDKFYWESEGLAPSDVVALVREKQRRKLRQLERAHTDMTAERARSETSLEGAAARSRSSPSREVMLAVHERDGGRCVRCGSNFRLQFDHKLPFSLGGDECVDRPLPGRALTGLGVRTRSEQGSLYRLTPPKGPLVKGLLRCANWAPEWTLVAASRPISTL